MIYGIGTDIVAISRVSAIYSTYQEKFLAKILSPIELTKFNDINNLEKKDKYLATRWAGKEAIVKALGTGFRQGLYLSNFSITNNVLGQPQVILSTNAYKIISNRLLNKQFHIHLSLSDDKDYALAYAIIETI
ncbi:MAG: holo-ACP synthase [Gammaproteobacteria bacterium]|nr:holo-ACP synthase [Gammaproteobacteria bacterium]